LSTFKPYKSDASGKMHILILRKAQNNLPMEIISRTFPGGYRGRVRKAEICIIKDGKPIINRRPIAGFLVIKVIFFKTTRSVRNVLREYRFISVSLGIATCGV